MLKGNKYFKLQNFNLINNTKQLNGRSNMQKHKAYVENTVYHVLIFISYRT